MRAPLPCDGLGAAIFTELNPRPLPLPGQAPDSAVNRNVVVTVESVILKSASEVLTRLGIYAHHAQRVEDFTADNRALVLHKEEFPRVPLASMSA